MNVKWWPEGSCYSYSCVWGCFEFDFESAQEAEEAFLWHDCQGVHEPPC